MLSGETAFTITSHHIAQYAVYLRKQERTINTVKKYVHDVNSLMTFLNGQPVTKAAVIAWKEHLSDACTPAAVNSMLAAANSFSRFMGWSKLSVRPLKIQRPRFCDENREMTRAECSFGGRCPAAGKRAAGPASPDSLRCRHPGVRTPIDYCGIGGPGPDGSQ